ncbi:hypothetical protein HK100_009182 [Physocladia obscura]|uniref:Uncharacterized protein n=1 Tax=Physocladia obscura TaxID=109957 RepID=A0AAD5SMU6_9FUNG|nr:hypothetical protein HK100_009182 [Physocladia obscura]
MLVTENLGRVAEECFRPDIQNVQVLTMDSGLVFSKNFKNGKVPLYNCTDQFSFYEKNYNLIDGELITGSLVVVIFTISSSSKGTENHLHLKPDCVYVLHQEEAVKEDEIDENVDSVF